MPEANGENVAATEVDAAGRPEVSDIIASNPMDFVPDDQPHMSATTKKVKLRLRSQISVTRQPPIPWKAPTTSPWFAARMTIYCTDSAATLIQVLLLTKGGK